MTPKTKQLIQLVKDRTLLREAPLVRDLILQLYGFDIDDPQNKRESTDVPGECPAWDRHKVVRKFAILVRYVRDRSAPVFGEYPKYNFWIVQDENKKRRCVHIKEGLNQDYILKNIKTLEKMDEARAERATLIRMFMTAPKPTREETKRRDMETAERMVESTISGLIEGHIKDYCLHRHIKYQIRDLRWSQTAFGSSGLMTVVKLETQIPPRSGYKPNYRGIQHVFGQSIVEIFLEDKFDEFQAYSLKDMIASPNSPRTPRNRLEKGEKKDKLLNDMLKQIILCDYQHIDYHRPDRNEEKIKSGRQSLIQQDYDVLVRGRGW